MKRTGILIAALALGLCGCPKRDRQDQAESPRIISYSPALTGIVFDMGLGDHVVGVTTYCVLPPEQTRPKVARTNVEKILHLRPDVILIQQASKDFDAVREADQHIRIEHFQIETRGWLAKKDAICVAETENLCAIVVHMKSGGRYLRSKLREPRFSELLC